MITEDHLLNEVGGIRKHCIFYNKIIVVRWITLLWVRLLLQLKTMSEHGVKSMIEELGSIKNTISKFYLSNSVLIIIFKNKVKSAITLSNTIQIILKESACEWDQ